MLSKETDESFLIVADLDQLLSLLLRNQLVYFHLGLRTPMRKALKVNVKRSFFSPYGVQNIETFNFESLWGAKY